jgi:polysaccharide export outer membrane protein
MPSTLVWRSSQRWGFPFAAIVLAALLAPSAGCQNRGDYHATALPIAYAAPPIRPAKSIDLSRFSRSTLGNNVIYPGDVIHVTVATPLGATNPAVGEEALALRVNNDGVVHDPEIGPIQVAGLELAAAEALIKQEAIRRGKYRDPIITVTLGERKANRVTVIGAVAKPGQYELPAAGSDLLAAISAAEGLTDEAGAIIEIRHPDAAPGWASAPRLDRNIVRVGYRGEPDEFDEEWNRGELGPGDIDQYASRRGAGFDDREPTLADPIYPGSSRRFVRIDLLEAERQGEAPDIHLEDGSAVVVMRRPVENVQVMGLVQRGAQYEIPPGVDLRVLGAIGMAGGLSMSLADKVHVIRQSPDDGQTILIETTISEAKRNDAANLRLMPGDVVSVEETPLTFVVSSAQNFLRFAAIPLF